MCPYTHMHTFTHRNSVQELVKEMKVGAVSAWAAVSRAFQIQKSLRLPNGAIPVASASRVSAKASKLKAISTSYPYIHKEAFGNTRKPYLIYRQKGIPKLVHIDRNQGKKNKVIFGNTAVDLR